MHCDVGAAVEHRLLDLLGEHALATDGVQLGGLVAVTRRRHQHVLDTAAESRADPLRLPARERARTRRDAQGHSSACSDDGRSNSVESASA